MSKYENMSKEELINLLIQKDNVISENKKEIDESKKEIANKQKVIDENKEIIKFLNEIHTDDQKELKKALTKIFMLNLQMLSLVKENQHQKETITSQKQERFGNKQLDRKHYINNEFGDGTYTTTDENTTIANETELGSSISFEQAKKKRGRKNKENGCHFSSKIPMKIIKMGIDRTHCECCGKEIISSNIKTREYLKIDLATMNPTLSKISVEKYKCNYCGHTIDEKQINIFDNQSFATPSLLATLCYAKYGYAMTVYRMEDILTKMGVKIPRQTICKYLMNLAVLLEPIHTRLGELVINNSAKVLHVDETPFTCILDCKKGDEEDKNIKGKRKNNYMWLMTTTLYDYPIYYFHYFRTRNYTSAEELLGKYSGYIMCDDFSAYAKLEKEYPNIKKVGCLFHAKKKYGDIVQKLNKIDIKKSEAYKIELMLSNIFHQENELIRSNKDNNNFTFDDIKKFREKKIKPLLDAYYKYIDEIYKKVDKEGELGKAIKYSLTNKEYFYRIFDDGRIPLSNIRAEQSIRPFTIIRKNALFAYNKNGANATAILMSIIQTCEANLIRPDLYIEYVLNNLNEVKAKDIDDLLPFSDKLPKDLYFNKKNSHNFLV